MTLRQIERDLLVPGQSLPFDVVDGDGRMLLPRGMPVADQAQVKALWTRGYLHEQDVPSALEPPRVAERPSGSWRRARSDEEAGFHLPRFFLPVGRMSLQLEEIFADILNGRPDRIVERVLELSRAVQVQLQRDADAFLAALELFDAGRYATLHALHSAALCDLVSDACGIDPKSRRILVAAALTRDVGFLELQEVLDRQPAALTEDQIEQVHAHPLDSARLLREAGVRDATWLAAVEQHHERMNGSGYPRGTSSDRVLPEARLLGIADIYSAMTKPRAYRPAFQSPNAVHSIFQTRGSLVDEATTQSFIRILGLFAPGLLVRLSSGEIAVVTRRTENLKSPEVRVIADAEEKLVPLCPFRDISDPAWAVADVLARDSPLRARLNHRQLWGEGGAASRR